MKRLVIVLGMHRSGTSVVSQVCQCMGGYLGEKKELMAATKDNMDGFYENIKITCINNEILQLYNREWYDLKPVKLDYYNPKMVKKVEELKESIQMLFCNKDKIVIKDPRISLLLPLWEKILDEFGIEVNYIWVFRNPLAVAESLKKRNGYSQKHSLLLWIHYNLSILKFLQGKEYILINYENILKNIQVFEGVSRLFDREFDENLKWKLGHVVKQKYCHSNFTNQDVINIENVLLLDLYDTLANNCISKANVIDFEKKYMIDINNIKSEYIDYDVLEGIESIRDKQIVIYGAGNFGKQAAMMLQQLGINKFCFCDKNVEKQGMPFLGNPVFSISIIEKMRNLLIIIAIEDKKTIRAVKKTLNCINGVRFLSFFALNKVWIYSVKDYKTMKSKAEIFSVWYKILEVRWDVIKNACVDPVLVYQNGKVGSSTVSESLLEAGIKNTHIHRFLFKNDIVKELILGKEQMEAVEGFDGFEKNSLQYVECVKKELKSKKIITLVRDPIAVDLSTVFEWIGTGVSDRYFSEQLKQGRPFSKIVSEMMIRIQDRMFMWFKEELEELTSINIFDYPFDREKGHSVIIKNGVEILILKAENLSQEEKAIKNFIGLSQFELLNKNIGKEKEYSYIYKKTMEKLKLPKEYIEHYYHNNLYMDYFYTEEEQKKFMDKWRKCIL